MLASGDLNWHNRNLNSGFGSCTIRNLYSVCNPISMSSITQTRERPPLRADARRNREAVLAAARERFGELGTECQMEDIARTAGVGVGTVYRHFPNKEALIGALVRDRFDRLAERAAEALEEDDPWDAFCDFMRFSAGLKASDRGLTERLASEPSLCGEAVRESGLMDLTAELIAKAQGSGKMRSDFTVEDVPTMLRGIGQLSAAENQGVPGPGWERFLEIMLDGLRAPETAEPADQRR